MSELNVINMLDAKIIAGGEDTACDEVNIRMQVNSPLEVSVSGMPRSPTVKVETGDKVLKDMVARTAAFQKKLFSSEEDVVVRPPDSAINLALDSGKVTLGSNDKRLLYQTGLAGTIAFGSIKQVHQMTDLTAVLSAWTGDIYSGILPTGIARDVGSELQLEANEKQSPVELILLLLEKRYMSDDFFQLYLQNTPLSSGTRELYTATHNYNKKVYPLVQKYLKANIKNTKLIDNLKFLDFGDANVPTLVLAIHRMVTRAPNMLEVLSGSTGLPYMFGIQMVPSCAPDENGFCSSLVALPNLYDGEAIPVTVAPLAVHNFSAGGGMFPVRTVQCSIQAGTQPDNQYDAKGNLLDTAATLFFPPGAERKGPASVRIEAPEWLARNPATHVGIMGVTNRLQLCDAASTGKAERDPGSINAKAIMQWLKIHYRFLALKDSKATVVVPLNLNFNCGRIYDVGFKIDGKDTKVFTGFADTVNHTLRILDGKGTAETTITFTHVRVGDFALPGL